MSALENLAYSSAQTARSAGTLPVCRLNPSTSRHSSRLRSTSSRNPRRVSA